MNPDAGSEAGGGGRLRTERSKVGMQALLLLADIVFSTHI